MHRVGLPCKHILSVPKHLEISEIPKCLVLRRLSKNARYCLPPRRTSDLFGYGWSGSGHRERHIQLKVLRAEACLVASNDQALYAKLNDFLHAIISKKYDKENRADADKNLDKEYAQDFGGQDLGIGDPQKVSTKGP